MKKLKYIELIIFVFFALFIGSKHEPWVDEAQSWLIARDASTWEIVWNISRYEGCFSLWYLILKCFIICGLKYEYMYIIPIIFSSIGLYVFLSSKKTPLYVQILLPFTYYIFYQYTIIARNYCLYFLAFSILLLTYDNRFEKPYKYVLNLIFFSLISMHGMLISGLLGLMFFLELITKKMYKNMSSLLFLLLFWVIEIVLMIPRSDLLINVNALHSVYTIINEIINNIIIYNSDGMGLFQNIFSFLIFLYIAVKGGINKENKTFMITEIGLIIFFIIIRSMSHHFGIMFFLVIFGIILNYEKILSKNKYFERLLCFMLILYCVYSVQASYRDLSYNYCGSKQMAEYIEDNIDYQDKKIYAMDYYPIAILPYFNENIFLDRNKTYYEWSKNNKIYYYFNNFDRYKDDWMKEILYNSDYILLDDKNYGIRQEINDIIEDSNLYELEYKTTGNNFYKNHYSETQGFLLYKKKSDI